MKCPKSFHSVIKLEATMAGKTMTKYLDELATDAARQNKSIGTLIKEKRSKKNDKKFNITF